jgi:hypothetical protein
MSFMDNSAISHSAEPGVLFNRITAPGLIFRLRERVGDEEISAPVNDAPVSASSRGTHRFAFAGLWFFTLLLYLRPNELFNDTIGFFPIVRYTGVITLLAYTISKLARGERLTIWPLEMKALALIVLLGVVFTPVAVSPADSVSALLDTFLKVVTIFVLLINLVDSLERLRSLIYLVVISGTIIGLAAIRSYLLGDFTVTDRGVGVRISGLVGGIFGNPNDLAAGLNLLLPLSFMLALMSRGIGRLLWLFCSLILCAGVIVTLSRGGFLGLLAVGGVLLWKFSGRHRAIITAIVLTGCALIVLSLPGQYGNRMRSIFSIEQDPTGSAQARRELLIRATELASRHLIFGVGMGNYHIYSLHEKAAHNSWLEISTELGQASDPELPRVFLETTYQAPSGRTINVPAGGDLQAAIYNAQPGDMITLQAGATFTGNFVLPNKSGNN